EAQSGQPVTSTNFRMDVNASGLINSTDTSLVESQSGTGLPPSPSLQTHRVQTDPDADGNRTDLLVKTGGTTNFANYFDYTSRNELLNIYDNSHAAFFKYSYDASGNVTQR